MDIKKIIMFGIDSITFRGSLLWNSVPDLMKSASSAALFKRNIKNWSGVQILHNVDFASFTLFVRDTGICSIVRVWCFSNLSNFCSINLDLRMLF